MKQLRALIFAIGCLLAILGFYGWYIQTPWSNAINALIAALGFVLGLTQLLYKMPISLPSLPAIHKNLSRRHFIWILVVFAIMSGSITFYILYRLFF